MSIIYTFLLTISLKEVNEYYEYNKNVFKNKTILLPCDDPEWSNFTKYFAANFDRFGLKKLISTSYIHSVGSKQLSLNQIGLRVISRIVTL
ncbi:adenine-specific methyltransferase EcoRI family protein [Lactococcus cremoris]|uniref:adenine-specific methyltransferase EcoRI family protein n=1 Tax=Lactococcus lactis subsp. cremoris TaxID=1359 RepID=UPI0009B5C920